MRTSLIRYIGTQQRWYVNALVNTGCADGTTYLTDKEIIPLETVIDDLQRLGLYIAGRLATHDIYVDELGVRRD